MRIRTILLAAILITALIPGMLYGIWSHNQTLKREFDEIGRRHLLVARNLVFTLDRYYSDLKSAFNSISATMLRQGNVPDLLPLMREHGIIEIVIIDKTSRQAVARAAPRQQTASAGTDLQLLQIAGAYAWPDVTRLTPLVEGITGLGEILAVHDYGERVAVARISTSYFHQLTQSAVSDTETRAAIFDQTGNLLAQLNAQWLTDGDKTTAAPVIRKLMSGYNGIETFHSPALGEDVIAGVASVPGAGWSVLVPQPVSEIRAHAFSHSTAILKALLLGLALTLIAVMVFVRSLVQPLEEAARRLKHSAASRELQKLSVPRGLLPMRELSDFAKAYNHMVDEMSKAYNRINVLAFNDPVTGLPNRARFLELTKPMVDEAMLAGRSGALFYIDLDDFKEINDLHGHDMGDIYLRLCGSKFKATLQNHAAAIGNDDTVDSGPTPVVARIGGDEFVLVVPNISSSAQAAALSAILQKEIAMLTDELGLSCTSGASIGCALYPADAGKLNELMKLADIAMYRAKKTGKGKSVFYNPRIGRQTPAEIRHEVLRAIENGELTLEYQPKIRTSDWTPNGAEALVRWDHPERGRLAPDLWLPAISDTTTIMRLGEWVIARAIKDYPVWTGGRDHMKLAVNFGTRHFVAPVLPNGWATR